MDEGNLGQRRPCYCIRLNCIASAPETAYLACRFAKAHDLGPSRWPSPKVQCVGKVGDGTGKTIRSQHYHWPYLGSHCVGHVPMGTAQYTNEEADDYQVAKINTR